MRVDWLVCGLLPCLSLVRGLGGGHFLEPENDCPERCRCNAETRSVVCTAIIGGLPPRLPPETDSLTIQNASDFYIIPKHAFRKMDRLREIRFENCPHLQTIEKFAFKNLRRLRLLSFSGCPSLTELVKGAFSSIQNEELLKILIAAPIRTVHGGAFRHASRLREVSISGSLMHLQKHAFSSINQLDFLDLSGVMKIDSHAFSNSTRFHIVNIFMSQVSIEKHAFADLNGIHQIIIHRCRLPVLESEAFSGVITLEHLDLCDNEIGLMSPHAFTGAINMGRIKLVRNKIERMESPDAVNQGDAVTLSLEGNKMKCNCDLKWMGYHSNRDLVSLNYCEDERSVRNYISNFCFAAQGSIKKSANRVSADKSSSTSLMPT
ncbi:hypothetical protein PMAYCL1PPCAC_09787, partial [Pristionchus mayeri]